MCLKLVFERFAENPLIEPSHVKPSRPGLEVACTFNAGVTVHKSDVVLLVRVAERPTGQAGYLSTIVLLRHASGAQLKTLRFKLSDPDLEYEDLRIFRYCGELYLTSLSHLRVARSKDGRDFTVDDKPAIAPTEWYEEFGIEDPRITLINGTYWITAVGVSRQGVATSLYSTEDFEQFDRHGIIFHCNNRDVAIFPEKIGKQYLAFHRPFTSFGAPSIWTARSSDLLHWGQHRLFMSPDPLLWGNARVGAGAVPMKTEKGWLELFHGATPDDHYCLGTLLLDSDQPWHIISRCDEPVFRPEAQYERNGFVPNVVFTCGMVEHEGKILMYYGAADRCIAGAETTLDRLLDTV